MWQGYYARVKVHFEMACGCETVACVAGLQLFMSECFKDGVREWKGSECEWYWLTCDVSQLRV